MTAVLRDELSKRLELNNERYSISTAASFADFVWDEDLRFQEILSLDPVVIVDAKLSSRRIVLQRIRGELRYWLTTDRDPHSYANSGSKSGNELGTVESIEAAVQLCEEFLNTEVPISELKTARGG